MTPKLFLTVTLPGLTLTVRIWQDQWILTRSDNLRQMRGSEDDIWKALRNAIDERKAKAA